MKVGSKKIISRYTYSFLVGGACFPAIALYFKRNPEVSIELLFAVPVVFTFVGFILGRKMAQQRRLLQEVVDNIPDMLFVKNFNKNLSFELWNKTAEDITGLKSADVLGKTDYHFFPKEESDGFTSQDKKVFESRETMFIPLEEINSRNGKRFLRTRKVPIYKADGSPDLLIGISTDITDEHNLQQMLELERAKSIHIQKLASLGEMCAGIAHEINNPLAIIDGNIELLRRHRNEPEKFEKKLADMEKSVDRISKIVSGLRKFARTNDGPIRESYSISKVIREVTSMVETKAKRHSVKIDFQLESESEILCDLVEIEQVMINLINNAVDAVKTQSYRYVQVRTFDEGNAIVVTVKDSGPGIRPEHERRLFQPFFTTKATGEGTGLGLSISKGILDQHNATIRFVKDSPETCFEIRFTRTGSKIGA